MEEQETGAAQLKPLWLFDILYKKQTERRGVATNRCSVREESRLGLSTTLLYKHRRRTYKKFNKVCQKGQSIIDYMENLMDRCYFLPDDQCYD